MASVLLHVCCAHCAAYCVRHWRERGHRVTAFWYNPNIHPRQEYLLRLEAMRALARAQQVLLIVSEQYDAVRYFRAVAGREGERCRHCFELRLSRTAQKARELGCDSFTTTLLISPQQRHDLVRAVGQGVAGDSGIPFLYEDLRRRYSDSRHITRGMDIYRQQYCGCFYSEWERYTGERVE
ncbi:MAG: epoxyqueuosine reductase QueH [Chloroflexota bacterium]